MFKIDERIDIVPGKGFKIIQNKNKFSYGTDAIFLSHFAKAEGKVMDLGTGTGIIPLRIYNNKISKIYGIEIQKEVTDMAKRSIAMNNLEDKIEIINMDLKNIPDKFPKGSFDTVISNPPYMRKDGAILNQDDNFALSRHEIACTIEDIVKVSEYLLKPQGKLYLVHRPDRLVDIIYNLRKYSIEPKYMQFVQPNLGKKPNLVLIESSKMGKPDLKLLDPIIIYKDNGKYTDEIYKIYGINKEIDHE